MGEMKLFTKRFVIFGLFFLLFPVCLIIIPREFYQGGNYITWMKIFKENQEIDAVKKGAINVLIGDSKSQFGLNAKVLNSVNYSLSGTTPVEGFFLLQNLLKRNAEIDTIYVSYGAHHLYHQDTFYPYAVYYEMISKRDLNQIINLSREIKDSNYAEITRLQRFKSVYGNIGNLSIAIYSQRFFDFLKFGLQNALNYEANKAVCLSQFENGYCLIDKSKKQISDTVLMETPEFVYRSKDLDASAINMMYLDSLLNLGKQHHISLYYVIMPVPVNSKRPDALYFSHYQDLIKLKFKENVVIDTLLYANKYFMDASHLNKSGVDHFSERISRRMKERS